MPKYDFRCKECGKEFEKLTTPQAIKDVKCLECGSANTHKLLSAPSIILKGGGFYKTDSRSAKSNDKKKNSD